MSSGPKVLAVIPARGASKGLPGKNIRPFAGLPLIAHSIRYARMCPEISRTVVSTDSEEIASVAREFGGEVPFLRPTELADDNTPMWPVLGHTLNAIEDEGATYEFLILLDPTSPAREPRDVSESLEELKSQASAEGIVGVSRPDFNPIWHCVVERDGWMAPLIEEGERYSRRQDLPAVYRINGALYIWRASFVRSQTDSWRHGRNLIYEMPEYRSMSIDTQEEFERAEQMVASGLIRLPWLVNSCEH